MWRSKLRIGEIFGYIIEEMPAEIKDKGFPWRAILFLPEFGKLYEDLTPEEYRKTNHRRKIVEQLKPAIEEIFY